MILILKTDIIDPVMQCTTLPSHSESLKRFLFHFSRRSTRFYRLSHSEIVDIEKVAVRSSLRLPNNKCALIEVILFSIHSDEWKSFQSQHQTALRGSNTLSWKPCQGGSSKLNLPDHSDQHKKLLDSVMLNKLKHDGEVEMDEEEATEEGREEVKPVSKKITMLDHSKAEQMGILKDVLCQVGVTTILAKFLILDIPVDKDVLIVLMTMYEAKHQRICECWLGYCANGSREQEMEFRLLDTTTLRELIDSSERLIAEEPAPGDPRVATTPFYF
ncbi:hypothetical protein Tco_1556898 [Tanacetum coccineum]